MNTQSKNGSALRKPDETRRIGAASISGLILLDAALRPIASDEGAARILVSQTTHSKVQSGLPLPLPPEVVTCIQTRIAGDTTSATAQFVAGNRRYKCQVYALTPQDLFSPNVIAVHMETEADLNDPIAEIAAEYDLTDRERVALKGIAMGLTTKELATYMNIKENTVKAFVRLIMLKLGIRNRTAIMARILKRAEGRPGNGVWPNRERTNGRSPAPAKPLLPERHGISGSSSSQTAGALGHTVPARESIFRSRLPEPGLHRTPGDAFRRRADDDRDLMAAAELVVPILQDMERGAAVVEMNRFVDVQVRGKEQQLTVLSVLSGIDPDGSQRRTEIALDPETADLTKSNARR